MKRIYNLLGLIFIFSHLSAMAQGVMQDSPISTNTFDKGDRKIQLTVGLGLVDYQDKSRSTFDQHLGMEWGVATIGKKLTLGIGFDINNTYGGSFDGLLVGEYNYTYTYSVTGKMYKYSTKKWERISEYDRKTRKGSGQAEATIKRDDINALFVAGLHFTPVSRLDTYVKLGVGVGYMNYLTSNIHNEKGFGKANHNELSESSISEIRTVFSYDDLAHVKWNVPDSKIVPAMAIYLGANYMLTDRWGAELQLGLISANLKDAKKGYPNSYGILAVGASYRF